VSGEPESVPDVYCDGIQIMVSPFGIILSLSQRAPTQGTEPPVTVAHVRMSLEHAKVATIMLKKVLRQHEDQQGSPIPLHPQVYQQMGISPQEDW
jgi:hypothetical protein